MPTVLNIPRVPRVNPRINVVAVMTFVYPRTEYLALPGEAPVGTVPPEQP